MKADAYVRWRAAAAAPLLLLAIGACQGEKNPQRGAVSEVLPGSIDDAMLPVDTLRSQPPLAPATQTAGRPPATAPGPTASGDPEDAASGNPPSPAASASPSAAASAARD